VETAAAGRIARARHVALEDDPLARGARHRHLASKPLCGQRISVRVAWERVASRREANFLQPFLQGGRPVLARSANSLQCIIIPAFEGIADMRRRYRLALRASALPAIAGGGWPLTREGAPCQQPHSIAIAADDQPVAIVLIRRDARGEAARSRCFERLFWRVASGPARKDSALALPFHVLACVLTALPWAPPASLGDALPRA
jgi:hypothetical protein